MRERLCSVLLGCAAVVLGGCSRAPAADEATPAGRPTLVVLGLDGGEWSVVERLWAQGELPSLADLAASGRKGVLGTQYTASPIIWTTIATGVAPAEHGITGFVVGGPAGDVPVSSQTRRVPALWSMASAAKRRVAVLGWWASWPAEEVNGLVVSDRVLHRDLTDRVSPAEATARIDELAQGVERRWPQAGVAERRDELAAAVALEVAAEGYDLLLVYFRDTDIAGHQTWRYFDPESFADLPAPAPDDPRREAIPNAYRRVDRTLAALREQLPRANFLVVSDHGFRPGRREELRLTTNFDVVLERLGWLARTSDEGIDPQRSQLWTHATEAAKPLKLVRFAPQLSPVEQAAVRAEVERELAACRWASGEPAFHVRNLRGPAERRSGADFAVLVVEPRGEQRQAALAELRCANGADLSSAVEGSSLLSGEHGENTHGLVIAGGPDLAAGPEIEGMTIHDVAPTVLYALGLPVADDFSGRAREDLFVEEFRVGRPLRRIASWTAIAQTAADNAVVSSAADQALVDELRSLGYLD